MNHAHQPRGDGIGGLLATRQTVGYFAGRHIDQVSRHCQPVACDVATRLALYDYDTCLDTLATRRRRAA